MGLTRVLPVSASVIPLRTTSRRSSSSAPSAGGNTTSSGGDGVGHRAIAAASRDSEMRRLPLRKKQGMTAESAGCRPFARIPVPIQDTYSVAENAQPW